MADTTLLQLQTDVASLRGQIAHLLANAELINLIIDGMITGPIFAFQPGSSPAVQETWHYLYNSAVGSSGAPTGATSGFVRYKLLADSNMAIINFNIAGSFAINVNIGTVPLGYRPASQQLGMLAIAEPTAPTSAGPRTVINTSGTFSANWPNGTATSLGGTMIYPLD